MKLIYVCKICGKSCNGICGLMTHVKITHKILNKDYYDSYLKTNPNEGICPICGKETKFINATIGYSICCSVKCGFKNSNKKRKTTNLQKWGVENPFQAEVIKEKIKETNLSTIGVENPMQLKETVDKIKQTCKDKYGDENYRNCDKIKETRISKYGSYLSLDAISKTHKKYIYNNVKFDSSWELAYYIWLKDNNIQFEYHSVILEYTVNDKKHFYYPDFKVNNELVEIKGSYLLDENMILINPVTKEKLYEKTQCLKDNNVKIITDCSEYLNYIIEKYGKHYLKQFKM